jgi:hypothetical protein
MGGTIVAVCGLWVGAVRRAAGYMGEAAHHFLLDE